MPRKFTDGFLSHAKKLILDGATLTEVAALLACDRDNLANALRRREPDFDPAINRGKRCPNRNDSLPEEDMIAHFRAGESVKALAARYAVARTVITRILDKHNIARRSRSTANFVRMSKMTEAERSDLAAAAHARVRSLPRAHFVRSASKRAISVQSGDANIAIGHGEQEIFNKLVAAGVSPVWQAAMDQYNVDMTFGTVAVEVRWGQGGRMKPLTQGSRLEKILNANLKLALVILSDQSAIDHGLDEVVALLQVIDRKPSTGRQYWVVRSGLQKSALTRNNGHKRADVLAPPELVTSIRECYAR